VKIRKKGDFMGYMDKMMEKMFEMCKEMENMPFMKNMKKDKEMEKMFEMCKEMENMPFMKNMKKDKEMEKCCDKMRDFDGPKMKDWCEMMRKR